MYVVSALRNYLRIYTVSHDYDYARARADYDSHDTLCKLYAAASLNVSVKLKKKKLVENVFLLSL